MNKSKRARRAGLAVGIAALGTMAFASAAQAANQPFTTTFNYGYAKLGNAFPATTAATTAPLIQGTSPLVITGQVDPATDAITAGDATALVRTLPVSGGNTALTTLDNDGPITGTHDETTGVTTMTGLFDVDLVVNGTNASFPPDGTAHCRYENVSFTFTTGNTIPRTGIPFAQGGVPADPDLGNNGAVAGSQTLPAVTAPDATGANLDAAQCNGVDITLTNSSADRVVGLWLGHNVLPQGAPGVGFQARFSQGLVNVGAIQNIDLSPSADIVYSGALIGTGGTAGTAAIQVPAAGFDFTPFTTSPTGTPLTIDITADSTINGSFNANTGALALPGNYTITINVAPGGAVAPYDCVSAANTLNLSSANPQGTAPAGGTAFDGFDGAGALSVSWTSLTAAPTPTPPAPATGCDTLNALGTQVVGGMWIARGINPPVVPGGGGPVINQPPPATNNNNSNTTKKCKKGQKLKKGKCVKKKKKKKK